MTESFVPEKIYLGKGEAEVELLLKYANRHGLVAGATGTGKTVTLQCIAEGLSRRGVPVFVADVKGDLAGLSRPGGGKPKLEQRAQVIGLTGYAYEAFPTEFWDIYGETGHPVRTTITELGPLLLGRLMNLNEVQGGVLNLAFKIADDEGLLLLDLKDLQAMMASLADRAPELRKEYGNVTSTTVGTIQRELLNLEQQGADQFLGEPALELEDFIRHTPDGRGVINILSADKLISNPRAYATLLLWLLSELFEELPEVGDLEKPKLVFFFDEAHLLFTDAPAALVQKVEQVVRLIRSKGVGIYFVTQNPMDIPDTVLAQLGNRVQHALRAFTPKELKTVKAASESFRVNPAFDTEEAITQLAVGEALVSCLQADGTPMIVQRTLVRPPSSRLGTITPEERSESRRDSQVGTKYDQVLDRESAYERLKRTGRGTGEISIERPGDFDLRLPRETIDPPDRRRQPAPERAPREPYRRSDSPLETFGKSILRSAGSTLGRTIFRGILGSLKRRGR